MAMEGIGGILRKKAEAKPNARLHSDAHLLADEMSTYFNERKRFGMYLGIIKRLGVTKARSIFSQFKSGEVNADNPRKMFMWMARNPGDDAPKP